MHTVKRFPTNQDFLSCSRLVKGSVASAGKVKGNAILAWRPIPPSGLPPQEQKSCPPRRACSTRDCSMVSHAVNPYIVRIRCSKSLRL